MVEVTEAGNLWESMISTWWGVTSLCTLAIAGLTLLIVTIWREKPENEKRLDWIGGFSFVLASSALLFLFFVSPIAQQGRTIAANRLTIENSYGISFSEDAAARSRNVSVTPAPDGYLVFENVLLKSTNDILDRIVIKRDNDNMITVFIPDGDNATGMRELPLVD